MVMLIPVLCLILVLTCALAVSVYLNVRQFTTAQRSSQVIADQDRSVVALVRTMMGEQSQQSADQVKQLQSLTAAHAKQLASLSEKSMEQLRLTLSDNSSQLREAVRVAWMPNPQLPTHGSTDQQPGKTPWNLPTPLAGDARIYDDSDPTDSFLSEFAEGRHQQAIIADDGELIVDGKYLGIPGLVPPPGVLDDESMAMLSYSEKLLRQGTQGTQGTQASAASSPTMPPGNLPTPSLADQHVPVGGL